MNFFNLNAFGKTFRFLNFLDSNQTKTQDLNLLTDYSRFYDNIS